MLIANKISVCYNIAQKEDNMDNYYAHTFKISNYNVVDFSVLENIFKTGYLLSRNILRMLGDTSLSTDESTSLYNGMDYISLCDLNIEHSCYSSFSEYTMNGLSLLFDHNIDVIIPEVINRSIYYNFTIKDLDMNNNRYTDFIDEVQVRDSISLRYLKGYCLSLSAFLSHHDNEYLDYYLECLNRLIKRYNYILPVYNLDNGEIINQKRY